MPSDPQFPLSDIEHQRAVLHRNRLHDVQYLYQIGHLEQAKSMCEVLGRYSSFPEFLRLRVLIILFNIAEERTEKEQLRTEAEEIYSHVRATVPEGRYSSVDEAMSIAAEDLQLMQDNQAKDNPESADPDAYMHGFGSGMELPIEDDEDDEDDDGDGDDDNEGEGKGEDNVEEDVEEGKDEDSDDDEEDEGEDNGGESELPSASTLPRGSQLDSGTQGFQSALSLPKGPGPSSSVPQGFQSASSLARGSQLDSGVPQGFQRASTFKVTDLAEDEPYDEEEERRLDLEQDRRNAELRDRDIKVMKETEQRLLERGLIGPHESLFERTYGKE